MQHTVDALNGLTDAGHHRVHLLGQVVLEVQAQPFLFLELLQGVGPLTGCQRGAILGEKNKNRACTSRHIAMTAILEAYKLE